MLSRSLNFRFELRLPKYMFYSIWTLNMNWLLLQIFSAFCNTLLSASSWESFCLDKVWFSTISSQEAQFNRLVSLSGQSKSGILPHFFYIWIDQEYFNSLNWRFFIIGFSDERKYSKIHRRTVQFKICSRASTQKMNY